MDSYWYLEHVTSGKKVIIQNGENTIGRHSDCKLVLKDYEFLSRKHAKLILRNGVSIEKMSPLNGIYINNAKLNAQTHSLSCGDQIGFGVEIDKRGNEVPENYAIFILKQSTITAEDIVLISDDEDDNADAGVVNEGIVELEICDSKNDIEVKQSEEIKNDNESTRDECKNRTIHLPKLPEVKKELLSQTSKEIESIFGEANEELLESLFHINPYIYKQLNNNNLPAPDEKICDGDVIELQEETPPRKSFPSPFKYKVELDNDEYDENFAMSQAILREMKEDMADALADLSDIEFDNLDNDDFRTGSPIKTQVATHINEDEIIIIEDDDDELLSKVADWSSKLFSQNVMSQTYPLEEKERSPCGSEAGQISDIHDQFQSSRALHIDSNASKEDAQASSEPICTAEKNSPENIAIRRCSVRLKSIDVSHFQEVCHDEAPECSTASSDKLPVDTLSSNYEINSNVILEVELVPQIPKVKSKPKRSKQRKQTPKKADSKSPKIKDAAADLKTKKAQRTTIKTPDTVLVARPKHEVPQTTTRGNYLRNRSKPCYVESLEEDIENPKASTSKISVLKNNSQPNIKKTTTNSKPKENNKEKPKENKPILERKSAVTDRLKNRSKSCLFDRSELNLKSAAVSTKNTEGPRKPMLIDPPHLPVHRGKLRGVSSEKREKANKNAILEKHRSINYEEEMKRKCYKKPADQKKDSEYNKKLRQEQLQKLCEKSKSKPNSLTDDSNCVGLKRKFKNVPTLSNSNRGEFLTKEVHLPMAKKRKMDCIEQEKNKTPMMKTFPKRRATIECSGQKDYNESPPFHYSRPPERKAAEVARNQRTCNRVTFADMDRDFTHRQDLNKLSKRNRHVRFNDNVQIRLIERVEGANRKVENRKDSKKFSLSRYSERREWAQAKGKLENYNDLITGNILYWGNQLLMLGNPNDVAELDVLLPLPSEFKSYKQYKDIIIPLMKVELLTTIERHYKLAKTTFEVSLVSFSKEDSRNRPRYLLVTRYNDRPKKFDLYTLCSGDNMKETFATLSRMQRVAGNVYELTFDILQNDISLVALQLIKMIRVRPVLDNMRVELGAFNAVYQLGRSPLFQRILKPSENVISFDSKVLEDKRYRGFAKLNKHQIDICKKTWIRLIDDSTPSITLIQGPPGTGKSAVIANLTLQCMYGSTNHTLDRKILICAHSNAAVDNIVLNLKHARECMSHSQFELLRFGFLEKMDHNVRELSLDHHLSREHDEKLNRLTAETINSLIEQQLELKLEIAELKRKSNKVSYIQQQLQSKENQLRLINNQLNTPLTPREEYELSIKYIKRANIVCTTLSSCVKLATFIDYFDACIIDEATQCTEPWTLLPLQFGVSDLVLVGDTQQLPATVLSQKALDFGLGNSMFDRIQRNLKQKINKERTNHFLHTKVFKLSTQYRMHPEICKWPNSYFYESELVNAESTQRLVSPIIPYCVINLSFTRDTNDTKSLSIKNDEEAEFVAKLLVEMDKHMPTHRYRYGLITPYSSQCTALSNVIPGHMVITPQTVDAYQGQERDVIILSNTRTRGVGFLTNYQRLNVAITRARRCLIICGNFNDLEAVDMWRHLLDDARKRNIYFDLMRNDVDDLGRSLMKKILMKPI